MSLVDRASQAVDDLLVIRRWLRDLERTDRDGTFPLSGEWRTNLALEQFLIRSAEPFWWEAPILDVVDAAAATLPTWTIRRELFPVPAGYFRFARPLVVEDDFAPDGLLYGPMTSDRIALTWVVRNREGVMAPAVSAPGIRFGTDIQSITSARSIDLDGIEGVISESEVSPRLRLLRWLGAALLFLEQGLAQSDSRRPDHLARREAAKADVDYPLLRVIRLRTPNRKAGTDDSIAVDWQFRWLVRGHWRQQFYASDGSHRPLWITPYVKGPEDKPLKAPAASVFAVVR